MGNTKRIAKRIVALYNVVQVRCESCGKAYDSDEGEEEPCPTCGLDSQPCPHCGNRPGRVARSAGNPTTIPNDGYADGGAPYTDEEMDTINDETVSVGDEITNPSGVNATNIPVGAVVRHSTGVDQKTGDYEVILSEGKKMLGLSGTPLWMGYGPMTVLSLP